MSVIRFVRDDDTPWGSKIFDGAQEDYPDARPAPEVDDGVSTSTRVLHPGDDDTVQLFEVRLEPDLHVQSHAHEEDELIYVNAGSIIFGSQQLLPGDSVLVPGLTLYSFTAGPEGARFLNFRSRRDTSYISKTDFVDRMRAKRAAADS